MLRSPAASRARRMASSGPPVTKWNVVPPAISSGSRSTWVSTNTGARYGGSGPHQPTQSRSHAPRPGLNMLRPMMNAPAARIASSSVAVLVGVVEHPGVERVSTSHAVAERLVEGLVRPGRVSVERDRDVAGDDAHVSTDLRETATTHRSVPSLPHLVDDPLQVQAAVDIAGVSRGAGADHRRQFVEKRGEALLGRRPARA